jgi:group I intron endonuclease
MKISGIYQIQSKIKPERIYIGSAVNISARWSSHLGTLRRNKHRSLKLQRHYNKYGITDLEFTILLGCEKEDLIKTEQYFIDSYNPFFNSLKIAGSPLGFRHSDEAKKKMSFKMMGNRRGIGNKSSFGKKQSAETIAKRIAKTTGMKRSEETKNNMICWNKGLKGIRGHVAWNKGLKNCFSEEAKKKLSEATTKYWQNKKAIMF